MRLKMLAAILLAFASGANAQTARVVAITQHSGLVERALDQFERQHGENLLDIAAVNPDVDVSMLEDADAIFVYYIPSAEVARLRPALAEAQQAGARVIVLPQSYHDPEGVFKPDAELAQRADRYWNNGGLSNIAAFLTWLYKTAGGAAPLVVPEPEQELTQAIYHPRAARPFPSLSAYLEWYGDNGWDASAPLVGVTVYSNSYKFDDLRALDALIAEIESRGLGVVPIFGWPMSELAPLMEVDGRCPLRVLLAMNVSVSQPEDPAALERYGLHTLNLISTRESREEWEQSGRGLDSGRIYALLSSPERVGATEPLLAATTETAANGSTYTAPIPERIRAAVDRAQAMALMGVRPVWNKTRNTVEGVELIPDAELGRPRVDVLFHLSGIYRDGFGDKVVLLNQASKLAALAGDNVIARHTREVEQALLTKGVDAAKAAAVARARAFANKPGSYGIGITQATEQSLNDDRQRMADIYLHYSNYAYSDEVWGEGVEGGLASHLKGNEAVVHSRSSNLYGLLDNDDVYTYVGGLNMVSAAVNGGAASDFYITNLRRPGGERVERFRDLLVTELHTRQWNPKWLEAMKDSGYAGARQMFREVEHLYGFQATTPQHIDESIWQETFDVYVADKHGLELDEFFNRENPHAQQFLLARLLEVDRQGTHRFSDEDRAQLIEKYVRSVNAHGAACSANTCGNIRVHQFVAAQASLISGLGDAELREFGRQMAAATHWSPEQFSRAPSSLRQGLRQGRRPAPEPTSPPPSEPQPNDPGPDLTGVTGFEMEQDVLFDLDRTLQSAVAPLPSLLPLSAIVLALVLGAGLEMRRHP